MEAVEVVRALLVAAVAVLGVVLSEQLLGEQWLPWCRAVHGVLSLGPARDRHQSVVVR